MKVSLPEFQPIAIRDGVRDAMRTALLAGSFAPGEPLSEPELAAQMKVSRGPVREALLMLAQEGLVTHSHNRGFAVFEMSTEDSRMIGEVRLLLEPTALALARKRIAPAQLDRLSGLRDEILAGLRGRDVPATAKADQTFHTLLWEAGGNPWLARALNRIMTPYYAFSIAYSILSPDLTEDLMQRRHDCYLDYVRGVIHVSAGDCVRFHLGLIDDPRQRAAQGRAGVRSGRGARTAGSTGRR